MLCWEPSRKFVFEFAKVHFFSRKLRESWILQSLCKGLQSAAACGLAGEGLRRISVWFWFPVWWCFWTVTVPFISSSRASKGEASRQPNAMVLKHTSLHLPLSLPNDDFWSLNKEAPNAAAKFPKVMLCESQTERPLVFAFPSMCPMLMAGVWIGIFSRKFRESSAKERAEVKVHVEGGGSVNFAKKTSQQQSVLRRDSVMLAACLNRLSRSDPWFSGVIWQVVNESS